MKDKERIFTIISGVAFAIAGINLIYNYSISIFNPKGYYEFTLDYYFGLLLGLAYVFVAVSLFLNKNRKLITIGIFGVCLSLFLYMIVIKVVPFFIPYIRRMYYWYDWRLYKGVHNYEFYLKVTILILMYAILFYCAYSIQKENKKVKLLVSKGLWVLPIIICYINSLHTGFYSGDWHWEFHYDNLTWLLKSVYSGDWHWEFNYDNLTWLLKSYHIPQFVGIIFLCLTFKEICAEKKDILQMNNASSYTPSYNNYEVKSESTSNNDYIARLKSLKELLDLGVITQEEFDEKKKEILG